MKLTIDEIRKMASAWDQVQEAKKKKLDPVGKADADIDNDGDVDSSDEYLHKRRKAIGKAIKGKGKDEVESDVQEALDTEIIKSPINKRPQGKGWSLKKSGEQSGADHDVWHRKTKKVPAPTFKKESTESDVQEAMTKAQRRALQSVRAQPKDKVSVKKAPWEKDDKVKKESFDFSDFSQEELIDFMVSEDFAQLDELSKKTLSNYIKKADKQAEKAANSYSNAALRRHDFAPDTPAMAKNAKKFIKRDSGADLARKKLAKKESVDLSEFTQEELIDFMVSEDFAQLDELSKKTLGSYVKKASADKAAVSRALGYSDAVRPDNDQKPTDRERSRLKTVAKRETGISKAIDRLTKEAKDHGNMSNGSPRGEGLSPSAKKELERTTQAPDAVDINKVLDLDFKTFKSMGKKAKARNNDNQQGDKTMPKNDGK